MWLRIPPKWCMDVRWTQKVRRDGSNFAWHQTYITTKECCKFTTSVDIQNTLCKTAVTHSMRHATVCLLGSREIIETLCQSIYTGNDCSSCLKTTRSRVVNMCTVNVCASMHSSPQMTHSMRQKTLFGQNYANTPAATSIINEDE